MTAAYASSAPAAGAEDAALAGALLGRGKLPEAEQIARPCAERQGEPQAARCALVLGRILFARNDAAGAAAALASASKLGRLQPVRDQLLGEALLLIGEPRRAIAPLRAAAAAGAQPVGLRAAALLADALHEAGDEAFALAQAARAAALPGQPAAVKSGLAFTRLQALGTLARSSRGAAAEALAAARAFWLEHPDHPGAAAIPGWEPRLAALAGKPLRPASGRELGLRASRLLAAGLPSAAVAQALAALPLLEGRAAAEVDLLLARALAADGRRAEATQALEGAWRRGAPAVAAPAGLLLARDRARRGATLPAIELLDELARKLPQAPEAEEAAYLAARLLLEDEGREGAAARARLDAVAAGDGRHSSDARWTLAWLSYKARKPEAEGLFAAFAARAADDASRAQGLYWQARAGRPDDAAALDARAAALDPLGWYGLLAQAGLAQEAPPPFPPPRPARAGPTPEALALAAELAALGFLSESAAEVDRYVRQRHGRGADVLPALALYERAGRYDRSVVVSQNALIGRRPDPADPVSRALLESAYPAAYVEEVAASAARARLDPYFLLAVARRESVFRPDARSAAGAVGLLQLTPSTARRIAAVLGRPAGRDDELFEPARAIDLGAWYLSELVGRFGDPAVAAAAYNAGTRAVEPWVQRGQGERLDEWVEDIPFRETRQYVKAVAGAWSAYRILAGGTPPRLIAAVPPARPGAEF